MTAPVIANSAAPVGIVLIDPATGLPYSAKGGVAISAGTNSQNSGTVVLSNSNGVSFGMGTNGVITATVTPGAAAGIGAIQLPNTTYTSGTVNFLNSNGLSFGSTTGGGVTASYTVPGATVFSNSNNVSFGLNGSTVTATATFAGGAGGAAISAGANSQNTGTVIFSNSNGLAFGLNAGTMTGSYTVPAATVFSNSNNVSFGLAGSTVTATATFAQTNQTIGNYAIGNTTGQSSSSTLDARSLSISGAGAVSVGISAGQLIISAAAGAQSAQTEGLYFVGNTTGSSSSTYDARTLSISLGGDLTGGWSGGQFLITGPIGDFNSAGVSTGGNTSGNTGLLSQQMVLVGGNNITLSQGTGAGGFGTVTISGANQTNQSVGIYGSSQTTGQSSSSTIDARSLSIVGAGIISIGLSAGSLVISAPGTTGLTQLSAGMSTGGNTAGTTGLASAQLVLAGGANVTLSGSTNAGSMTISVVGGAGGGGAAISAGTQSTNGGTVVFSNSNGISFGMSNSSVVTATYTVPTQTNQTVGLYGLGNTTQNSSTTLDARTLSFNGLGEISVGYSNGSIQLSAPAQSIGVSNVGNTSGNTGSYSGQVILAGGNNCTLSVGTGANGAQTITVSVASQTNQTVGLYAVGNTTQNSSTTLDARTLSFDALGAMTAGFSNGSIQLSAPATSSLVGTGQLSVSTNGSTISIGAASYGTLSYWDNDILNGSASFAQLGVGSVVMQALKMPGNLSISALREFISGSFSSSSNSSYANTLSFQAGIYTLNGSTLSLASSGSQSYAYTNTSNNSLSVLTGIKGVTVPINASMTPGVYWVGLWSNSASANANWATVSNVIAQEGALTYNGLLGASTNASNQAVLGAGVWSTTSANLPASIGLSQITGSTANFAPFFNLYNVSA